MLRRGGDNTGPGRRAWTGGGPRPRRGRTPAPGSSPCGRFRGRRCQQETSCKFFFAFLLIERRASGRLGKAGGGVSVKDLGGGGGEGGRRDVADRSIRAASQPASRSACSGDWRGCTSQCTLTAGWAALTARKGEIGRAPVLKSGTSGGVRGSGTCSQAALSAASESVSRQRAWRKP